MATDATMTSMTADDRMSDIDALIWAIEHDPRLRSTITAVAVFDGPLDRRALRHRIERATRVIPRLRHHVVTDPLGLAPPRWEHDDDFCLAYHLRVASLGGDGTRRELYDLTEELSAQPFDRARPPWEITHVEGLADGQSALIIKSHHAISDGIGGVELSLEIFDLGPEAEPEREELPPVPQTAPATDPLQSALHHEVRSSLAVARGALAALLEAGADPLAAAHRVGELLGSANRQLRPPGAPMSTTMRSRSVDLAFDAFSVPLEDLRRAGRRVEGTINDAFVAAVVLGTSAYHRRHGDALPFLRLAIPVNRRDDPAALGNHWTPGRLELELGPDDPDIVLARVRDHMRRLRAEPVHDLLDPLAGVLRRLPNRISSSVASSLSTAIDVAASNVPGSPVPLFLQGRSVTELTPFGPLSGAATNVTLLSHGDQARIGVNRDPAAVPDGEAFTTDLHEAFERVIRGARP